MFVILKVHQIVQGVQQSKSEYSVAVLATQIHIYLSLDNNIYNSVMVCYPHYMDKFCIYIYYEPHDIYSFKGQNGVNLFSNSNVLYPCLFDVKRPGDDRRKNETCWSIIELHVKMYF